MPWSASKIAGPAVCQEVILLIFSTLVMPYVVLCPVLGSQVKKKKRKKDSNLLERIQHRAKNMIKGLKHLPYEERLRDLRLFSLEKAEGFLFL